MRRASPGAALRVAPVSGPWPVEARSPLWRTGRADSSSTTRDPGSGSAMSDFRERVSDAEVTLGT
ncbi:hypothetical protein ACFFRL_14595 [Agromyces hippuratus]|uniref:hypothetical protein n=1 Tax=Agromyces hippuratus TaxID=286438 RepID=UPI0035E77678